MRLPVHDQCTGGWPGRFPDPATFEELITTLLITIGVESTIVLGYCVWRGKPTRSILLTSICANVLTQSLLGSVLSVFFQYYIIALLIAEIFIWVIESLALHFIPANGLRFSEAISLSFFMNISSFALGWFLPV
jgi:hypothetical protein